MTTNTVSSLRSQLGWSQRKLASALGVSQPTISLWEQGKSQPTQKQLKQLRSLRPGSKTATVFVPNLRKKYNWTQTRLGLILGTTQAVISAWERGKASPSTARWILLEAASIPTPPSISVRSIRAAFNWSQTQLATYMDATQGKISSWERGASSPKPQYCAILNVLATKIAKDETNSGLGYNLRDLRRTLGWSQTELAEYLGVTQGNISLWERNKAQPTRSQESLILKLQETKRHSTTPSKTSWEEKAKTGEPATQIRPYKHQESMTSLYTTAAIHLLGEAGRPLHYRKLTTMALERGLFPRRGETQYYTLNAALGKLSKSTSSPLIRASRGYWALATWKSEEKTALHNTSVSSTVEESPAKRKESSLHTLERLCDNLEVVEPRNSWPAHGIVSGDLHEYKVDIYIRPLGPSGRKRPEERRFQNPGSPSDRAIHLSSDGQTLLLGLWLEEGEDRAVVVSMNAEKRSGKETRFSMFVPLISLQEAAETGYAQHRNASGEVMAIVRVDQLAQYVEQLEVRSQRAGNGIKQTKEDLSPLLCADSSPKPPIQGQINIRPKVGMYAAFARLNYKPWFAISEFIDNAIQSFLSNRNQLESHTLDVDVRIDEDQIVIIDRAAGIPLEDFPRAFSPSHPPPDNTGLSELGAVPFRQHVVDLQIHQEHRYQDGF